MTQNKRVGEIVCENNDRNLSLEDHVREYSNAMQEMILKELHETAKQALKMPYYEGNDLYIELVKNINPLFGQPQFKYTPRKSCPYPVYKQDLFKYHHQTGVLEFLWCIPSQQRYYHILNNKQLYLQNKETARLAQFVILMESGKLKEWANKENGDLPDAVIMIN